MTWKEFADISRRQTALQPPTTSRPLCSKRSINLLRHVLLVTGALTYLKNIYYFITSFNTRLRFIVSRAW